MLCQRRFWRAWKSQLLLCYLNFLREKYYAQKIPILNIITLNKAHAWKLLSSWDMLEWTHKSWKLKIQFCWNPSIILKNIDYIIQFNWKTTCSWKKYYMPKNIFAVSQEHKVLAIFTHLVHRIQRDLSDTVIILFLHS